MKWFDLHVVYLLIAMLVMAFLAAGFGKAPVHWLLLGAAIVAQFPLWTKVADRVRGKHPVVPYVAANEVLIAVLCGLCWLAVWGMKW